MLMLGFDGSGWLSRDSAKRRAAQWTSVVALGGISCFMTGDLIRYAGPSQGSARLVSIEPLGDGESCTLPAPRDKSLFAGFETVAYAEDTAEVNRSPVRTIKDSYPIYSSVAVDPVRDEVVLQDTNLFSVRVFNRTDNTPPTSESTTPKRVIQGDKTHCEYNNGLSIDPATGDIYSVAMDTEDNVLVFGGGAEGNVAPQRILKTPHRNFASALDNEKGDLYVTIQYPPKVVVYKKGASGTEQPLRVLEGPDTYLHDTHGLALDFRRRLMYVGTWGNSSDPNVAGSGKMFPPSINVYPMDASGDTAPIRMIQGPKTKLDWAGGMTLDPESGDLWVANDVSGELLVFNGTAQGDVAPARVIGGAKTGMNHPAGIAFDAKNREVWVSNMGNSSASAFSVNAVGDVAPLRTIRSAPAGRKSVKFGKPQAVAFDSKRDYYLVPN
jgi:hypothetical protein